MTTLRHSSFSTKDIGTLASQLGENARDTQAAVDERVRGRIANIPLYSATGATTTRITLPTNPPATPYGVLLVRVALSSAPTADLTLTPRYNFAVQDTLIYIYEPGGLTANISYDLTFLILER